MSDLTEFLLARIAEDEAAAQAALGAPNYPGWGDTAAEEALDLALSEGVSAAGPAHFARHDPARVLRECEAKSALLLLADPNDYADDGGAGMSEHADEIHRLLALPYADHPDFRDEWR